MRSSMMVDHWSCCSPPGVPKAIQGTPSRKAMLGDNVVRGRLRGARPLGRPGLSQNICPRVPMQKPRPGTTGELCSQPPEGVALTMFPQRSITSICTVSAPITPRRATVGSPIPGARVSSSARSAAWWSTTGW